MKTLAPNFDKTAEGVWPNQSQQLLLQAALLDAPDAPQAWSKWQERVVLDEIDPASWKLLPLVYVNLKRLKIADPLLPQIKEMHFHHWRTNQMLFQQSASFLDLMREWNLPILILKGVALAHLYYPDTGSRPMADLDILVPTDQFLPVCERLKKLGWKPTLRDLDQFALEDEPSFGLVRSDGLQVDIHGHVLHANCSRDADAEFWKHAEPFTVRNRPALTLAAEDHLLHVLSHGIRWCDVPPFRWVADAWWILARRGPSFDWERFINQTRFHHANLEVFRGLELIDNLLPAKIPPWVLDRLNAIPSPGEVHVRYAFNTYSVPVSGVARALAIWRGSSLSAPVYRLDGRSPRERNNFLSALRKNVALLDYAFKTMIRIAARHFQSPRAGLGQKAVGTSSSTDLTS